MSDAQKILVQFARDQMVSVDSILECVGDGLTIQDRDLNIIYQNDAITRMMGDHLGEPCYRAYHKRDEVCLDCQAVKVFQDGGTHRKERSVPETAGTAFVSITASPLKDTSGRIVGAVEVVRDITERRRIEREREELIEKLERAAAEISTLRGILPICSHCKKVRNDEGYYEQIEAYLRKRSNVDFSHTICPACVEEHYAEFKG